MKTVVWRGGQSGSPCCQWWAPELHHVDGGWYIYTTADDGNNDNHRLQVLAASNPLGPYTYKGQLTTPGGDWSIDPAAGCSSATRRPAAGRRTTRSAC